MAYLEPLETEQLAELKPILAMSEATMGFVPNSMLTMAHMRQLPVAFSVLFGTVMGADVKVLMENLIKVAPERTPRKKIYPRTCFSSSRTASASALDVATAKLIPDTIPVSYTHLTLPTNSRV